jgi:hypothetical protein|tara:strand:- start:681 stop:905 length:225 start_codon:yes stop_codon:yes gene_type:complete
MISTHWRDNMEKKFKFTLMNFMCDILGNFYDKHNLEHICALESQMVGNYKTDEQLEWLERFSEVWEKVADREVA